MKPVEHNNQPSTFESAGGQGSKRWNPETRYKILLAINNAVITKISREEFFKSLADELKKYLSHNRLSINLYDVKSQTLSYFASADGIDPKGIDGKGSRPLSQGSITRMVIESRQPVIITDLNSYSSFTSVRAMQRAGLNATMAFPLIVHDHILGSIHFSFRKKPENISELTEVLIEVSQQVTLAVDNMLTYTRLVRKNENLAREKHFLLASVDEGVEEDGYFYTAPSMVEIMTIIRQAADTDASMLITGETGTGKDYLAKYLHQLSGRRNHLLVKVNCPALSASLFESELFGHGKGAFTGAEKARTGRFELANRGTVFLDEIAELPISLQAKLLHVLQDRRFERVGDSRSIDVNFRLIAATNRDLVAAIESGQFRKDLFYRLNTVNIQVPPLRERAEDIPHLVQKLTEQQARQINRPAPVYTESAVRLLCGYDWPGNVRELKNIVNRLAILRPGQKLTAGDIGKITNIVPVPDLLADIQTLPAVERQHIERVLKQCRGRIGGPKGAARQLGLPRTTLQYRMKKYGLKTADYA